MSNTARKLEWFSIPSALPLTAANSDAIERRVRIPVPTIAAVLIALQVLDGVLTFTGMSIFGFSAEGNPILRSLMDEVGLIPALLVTKGGCIAVVVALCSQLTRITWLPAALSLVAVVYATCAVVPWSFILASAYFG